MGRRGFGAIVCARFSLDSRICRLLAMTKRQTRALALLRAAAERLTVVDVLHESTDFFILFVVMFAVCGGRVG
jgi:hypothetical protein